MRSVGGRRTGSPGGRHGVDGIAAEQKKTHDD